MNKTAILSLFLFINTITVSGQVRDSILIVAHIDSLIGASRDLVTKGDFDNAIQSSDYALAFAEEYLGKESNLYARVCNNNGRVFAIKGNNSEAESWLLKSKSILEMNLAKESKDYAMCLNYLGTLNLSMRNYEKAEIFFIESNAIREKVTGKEHPDYAQGLNNLANLYMETAQFDKAEQAILEVTKIREKVLGKQNPEYAQALNNLASLYEKTGRFDESEQLYLETKALQEKNIGKQHPHYARTLNNLAFLYREMGQFDKSEPLYIESKEIREKVLGKVHPEYAQSLENLAILYGDLGLFEKTEKLYLESKEIRKNVLGKQHPQYAQSLNNLAILYQEMDKYEKAEPLYLEAKEILEKAFGKEHPNYAAILNNLANFYKDIGQYEKAKALHLESIAIKEKLGGKQDKNYAMSLENLANLYMAMKQNETAEALYIESIEIKEKILGVEHPGYASAINNLGIIYLNMDIYEKAESLFIKSLIIQEKVLGKQHPVYANTLSFLATLYLKTGKYDKAEPLYIESKEILEKVFGKKHLEYGNVLEDLSVLFEAQNRFGESDPLITELFQLNQGRLSKSVSFLSEHELTSFILKVNQTGNQLSSFLLARYANAVMGGMLPETIYNDALFQKGFLLTAASRLNVLSTSSLEAEALTSQLKGYRRRLADEYANPIAEQKGISELEEKANVVEKELARTVSGYAEANRQVSWQEVRAGLKQDETAIEIVHFQVNFPNSTDSTMYAALVLRHGAEQPDFIPLFEAKQLEDLLHTSGEKKADYANTLYSLKDRGVNPVGKPEKTIYELLWKPLEKKLSDTKTIYFSPSGLLHHLNLAAIPIGIDSVLGDRYQLVELGSTRSLAVGTKAGQLVVPNQVKSSTNDAVLFGGIQYDTDITALANANASIDSVSIASRGELNFSNTDSTLRVGTWGSLPFTDREVGNLERILKTAGMPTQTRRGYSASEEAFKTIGTGGKPSPRILHIATHGFFFPDPKTVGSGQSAIGREPVFKISEHPMIRSGLLLAGANHAWKTGKPLKPGMEDGILTAYEISQMNLSNTELVVLSACETGLGDIQGNEGVYGLQRAFKIAGAKYLIMSLWQVPDKQTSLLMTTFYKKWLEAKMTIPEAFRAAQKELRDAGLDPYQWAGFVLVE